MSRRTDPMPPTSYSDKYTACGTSYSDKHSARSTSHSAKFGGRPNTWNEALFAWEGAGVTWDNSATTTYQPKFT